MFFWQKLGFASLRQTKVLQAWKQLVPWRTLEKSLGDLGRGSGLGQIWLIDTSRCLSSKPPKDLHFKIESDSKTVANALQPCLIFLEMATPYFAPIHSQAEKPHVLLCRVSKIGHAGDIQKHNTCVCLNGLGGSQYPDYPGFQGITGSASDPRCLLLKLTPKEAPRAVAI